MANHRISANQLSADKFVHIRGKLTFSRLASLIEGDELAKANARRPAGTNAINVPYTTINIAKAEVLYADPANPTIEEQFVDERRFTSTKYPENGLGYSFDNKSSNLPIVGVMNAEGQVEQVVLENELANGLDVTLVLRTYKPKNFSNYGLSLDLVLVNEPIRFYVSSGVNTQELASRGIVFAKPPVQVSGANSPAAAAAVGAGAQPAAALPANTDPESGLPSAVPAAAAVIPTVPVVQAAQAVVAQPAVAAQPQAAAPQVLTAAPAMSAEEELRQLKAKIAADEAKKLADANSGGSDSAFAAEGESPWETPAKQTVGQGIEYSG